MDGGHVLVNEDVANHVENDDGADNHEVLAEERQGDEGTNGLAEDDQGGDHRGALKVNAGGDGNLREGVTGEGAHVQVEDHEYRAAEEGLQDIAVGAGR